MATKEQDGTPEGDRARRARVAADEAKAATQNARIRYYAASRETLAAKRKAYDEAVHREIEAEAEASGEERKAEERRRSSTP